MTSSTLVVTVQRGEDDEVGVVLVRDAAWSPDLDDVAAAVIDGERPSVTVISQSGPATRGPEIVEVLVGIGTWAATSAAWDVSKAIATAVIRRITGREVGTAEQTSDDEAIARTRWVLAHKFDEDEEGLVVDRVDDKADGALELVITGDAGRCEYICLLEAREDGVTILKIRRTPSR